MEIYLELNNNEVVNVFTENIHDKLKFFTINSMDDFYSYAKGVFNFHEEIEEKIKEIIEAEDNDESLSMFNIKHWVSNRSFGELIDMYEHGEIIKPEMQREFVWDSLKCSRLIESIILGLPIPPLFLLEVGKNKYELIDGLQRMTTVYNYVMGNPWHETTHTKRKTTSKLSSKVSKEIQGKTFEKLNVDHQRAIKRSTIPLIEFKQLEPDNMSSKYLIFERINTGSEKLNPMQIRKSLAHGSFIKDLYSYANINEDFLKLFNASHIKKDNHIEAFLRINLMVDVKNHKYEISKNGISNILNDYCETNRDTNIEREFLLKFNKALDQALKIFGTVEKSFRRVERSSNGDYLYAGSLNIGIMEALMAELIEFNSNVNLDILKVRSSYEEIMSSILEKSIKKEQNNPFTTSTGSLQSIKKRLEVCKDILENANK